MTSQEGEEAGAHSPKGQVCLIPNTWDRSVLDFEVFPIPEYLHTHILRDLGDENQVRT